MLCKITLKKSKNSMNLSSLGTSVLDEQRKGYDVLCWVSDLPSLNSTGTLTS